MPEENELVVAIVKKIMPYGAICTLIEYDNQEAFLHVSEVASRWIKNIHEFLSDGQRIVARVHHIDKEKNQIDISLKRVTEEEKRRKLEEMNYRARAKKLIEIAVSSSKIKKVNIEDLLKKMEEKYGDAYSCLKEVSEKGESVLKDFDLPKTLVSKIVEIAKKNIKKQLITLDYTIKFYCFGGEGVNNIKECFETIINNNNNIKIHYLGAPRYKVSITAEDYKIAEKEMKKTIKNIESYAKKYSCIFEIERENK
ncbi:MAG: translation initiation factor IF-2 subunit alpha [Candidatus Bilamarchaeaceae archaeon]